MKRANNNQRLFSLSGHLLLAASLALGPLAPSAFADQTSSQTSAGSTNSMASMLSSAVGVVSMAAGALSISKGVQEMQCCSQGCSTGAGTKATADQSAVKGAASAGASAVSGAAKRMDPSLFRRFPDSAKADQCPATFLPTGGRLGGLLQLVRPQAATATGCLDAALSMATGGLMLLSGAAGLLSAQQASQNADTANSNADGLTSTALPNTSLGSSNVGGASTNVAAVVDPALLRDGTAGQVMSDFEKQFGIGRDQFANAVANGEDAKSLLSNAPSNPISPTDLDKATGAANNMSDADKQAALANSAMNSVQSELASKVGDTYAASSKSGTGTTAHARAPASIDDFMNTEEASGGAGDMKVNPDIKSALAARDAAASKKSYADTSLFEVVHAKYREKMTMISGANLRKGIGGPDGN